MSHTKYYIGFAASEDLVRETKRLLELRGNVPPHSLLKPLESVVDAFIPDVLANLLIRCCDAIGLSPMANKIVNGGVDTLNSACGLLVGQLMKKRSDEETVAMVHFIDDIFLPEAIASNGADSAGAEISKAKFDEMKHVTNEIMAGRAQQVLPQLHTLMIEVADLVQDSFMKRPLAVLNLNFVIRKVVDGTFATCKATAHMVVNRVFKQLNDEELRRLAEYFDKLLITAEVPV